MSAAYVLLDEGWNGRHVLPADRVDRRIAQVTADGVTVVGERVLVEAEVEALRRMARLPTTGSMTRVEGRVDRAMRLARAGAR